MTWLRGGDSPLDVECNLPLALRTVITRAPVRADPERADTLPPPARVTPFERLPARMTAPSRLAGRMTAPARLAARADTYATPDGSATVASDLGRAASNLGCTSEPAPRLHLASTPNVTRRTRPAGRRDLERARGSQDQRERERERDASAMPTHLVTPPTADTTSPDTSVPKELTRNRLPHRSRSGPSPKKLLPMLESPSQKP